MFTPDFEAGPERGNAGPWLARNHGFPALPLRSGSSGLPEYRLRLPHWVTRMNLIWFCLALVFCVDFHLPFHPPFISPLSYLSLLGACANPKSGLSELGTARKLQVSHAFSCEIVPFKQAYIERNFQPPILFRDLLELGKEEA